MRADCGFGHHVKWRGGKFMVIDYNGDIIGEADPGFRPLPQDVEWAAKVEYAKHYGLPYLYEWTKKLRDGYEMVTGTSSSSAFLKK